MEGTLGNQKKKEDKNILENQLTFFSFSEQARKLSNEEWEHTEANGNNPKKVATHAKFFFMLFFSFTLASERGRDE